MSLEDIVDDVIETDVLVVGGGIGGPFAAITASEQGARAVLLDKAAVRRSGAAGMGIGGWHQLLNDKVTLKDIAEDIDTCGRRFIGTYNITRITKGLVNENLPVIGYSENWEIVHRMEKWGIKMTWDDGQYSTGRWLPDNMRWHGVHIKRDIARALKKSPVTVLERTMGVDLLTKDGAIAGATALNVRTGKFTLIKAKAIVLAAGWLTRIFTSWIHYSSGRFKMLHFYYSGSGDGIAMAFRAGAELLNMDVPGAGQDLEGCKLADRLHLAQAPFPNGIPVNARGEEVKGLKGPIDVDMQWKIEREGKGPCFIDFSCHPEEWHKKEEDYNTDSAPIQSKFMKERGLDPRKDRFELSQYRPEMISDISGVTMGEDGQTNVKGLYAVGSTAGGNTFVGAAEASVFGTRAGKHAVANLAKMEQVAIDEKQVAKCRETVFAPNKVRRGVEPLEVEMKIRDIVERYCGPERSEGSIDQGLWRLRAVGDRFLPELMARDNHELMSAQEVRNLFLLAEVHLLCSRQRKESGMRTFRLDYPEKANDPWKEATVARLEGGEIKITRRKLPELREEFRSK